MFGSIILVRRKSVRAGFRRLIRPSSATSPGGTHTTMSATSRLANLFCFVSSDDSEADVDNISKISGLKERFGSCIDQIGISGSGVDSRCQSHHVPDLHGKFYGDLQTTSLQGLRKGTQFPFPIIPFLHSHLSICHLLIEIYEWRIDSCHATCFISFLRGSQNRS